MKEIEQEKSKTKNNYNTRHQKISVCKIFFFNTSSFEYYIKNIRVTFAVALSSFINLIEKKFKCSGSKY